MLTGAYTALITPYKDGNVDYEALRTLVEWQINQGIDGLVACASTGEAFYLTHAEQAKVIKTVIEVANKRVPVIAGTSAFTLKETLELTKQAEALGPDALMIVTPPYMKPTQEALYDYFKGIHDKTSTPILLYDNPGRSSRGIDNATVISLAKLPRIQAIKDAAGDLTRPATLLENLPADFALLTGEDPIAPGYFAQGGVGVISVTANVAPNLVASQWKAWCDRDLDRLAEIRTLLNPLHRAMFIETTAAAAKYTLSQYGFCSPDVREPLTPMTIEGKKIIDEAIQYAGLQSFYKESVTRHHG